MNHNLHQTAKHITAFITTTTISAGLLYITGTVTAATAGITLALTILTGLTILTTLSLRNDIKESHK